MEKDAFKDRVKRLDEVNAVIKKLDPSIREAAFSLLAEYVSSRPMGGASVASRGTEEAGAGDELFASHPDAKPAENVNLIAAHFYGQYGSGAFSLEDIRSKASAVGLTIPTSLGMTLKSARRGGKALFEHSGRNEFKPTVHGELYFKNNYHMKKGTKPRPAESSKS
jgi:hypothetical protein